MNTLHGRKAREIILEIDNNRPVDQTVPPKDLEKS